MCLTSLSRQNIWQSHYHDKFPWMETMIHFLTSPFIWGGCVVIFLSKDSSFYYYLGETSNALTVIKKLQKSIKWPFWADFFLTKGTFSPKLITILDFFFTLLPSILPTTMIRSCQFRIILPGPQAPLPNCVLAP